jgi:hypothetical protein
MANFDERAKEHVGSVTFKGCIVPENVSETDEYSTEASSCSTVSFYYVNRMVTICSV